MSASLISPSERAVEVPASKMEGDAPLPERPLLVASRHGLLGTHMIAAKLGVYALVGAR